MVSALVLSLWENSILNFMKDHPVDTIDIKTTSHIYTFDVKDLESFSDEPVYYTIKLKGGREICLL